MACTRSASRSSSCWTERRVDPRGHATLRIRTAVGGAVAFSTPEMSVVTDVPQVCATPAPVPPRTTGARAPWRDSLLIGAIAAVLYTALSQSTLYGDAAW